MAKFMFGKSARKALKFLGIAAIITFAVALFVKSRSLVTGKTLTASEAPQIAFLTFRNWKGDVYVYDHAAGKTIKLTQTDSIRDAAWSPDGRYLAFQVYAQGDDNDVIYRLDVTSGELLRLTPIGFPDCNMPAWSPDGKWIACYTDGLDSEIFLIQANGTGTTSLTSGSQPSWSSDGKRLIYILRKDLATSNLDADIATIDIQTGTVAFLAELDGYEAFPRWSPDEKMVAFVSADSPWGYGNAHDFSINILSGDSITIVSDHPSVFDIYYKWSPDGAALRFANCEYYPASGETSCRGSIMSQTIDFSPDGKQILQVDLNNGICIIPIETDCVELPKEWETLYGLRVIGWRP
ncbi:MAG: hypothetical protein GXP40_08270 [Chloroflexi bacterium]|nr:hypothetical protein [Chloroflexota bacterium]